MDNQCEQRLKCHHSIDYEFSVSFIQGNSSPSEPLSENEDETIGPQCTLTGDDYTPTSSQIALDQEGVSSSSTHGPYSELMASKLRVCLGVRDGIRPSSGLASMTSRASFNTLKDIADHDDTSDKGTYHGFRGWGGGGGGVVGVCERKYFH